MTLEKYRKINTIKNKIITIEGVNFFSKHIKLYAVALRKVAYSVAMSSHGLVITWPNGRAEINGCDITFL